MGAIFTPAEKRSPEQSEAVAFADRLIEEQSTRLREAEMLAVIGEMTGAISINMILSMLPVTLWCFLGRLIYDNVIFHRTVAVIMACWEM